MSFLKVEHLSKAYSKGAVQIPALEDVSFELERGEFGSVIGRSGSGKSTLLNLIGGLDRADSGHIFFRGDDLTRMRRPAVVEHRRFCVGMVFQSFNLISSRTALENVTLALLFGRVAKRDRRARAVELLDTVGLAARLSHKPSELSGGEAQRVAIARALANRPALLLADEPTGNLDSATSREIIELLVKLNRGHGLSVLLVTHDQSMAESVSHRIIQLLDGRIINEKVQNSTDAVV